MVGVIKNTSVELKLYVRREGEGEKRRREGRESGEGERGEGKRGRRERSNMQMSNIHSI